MAAVRIPAAFVTSAAALPQRVACAHHGRRVPGATLLGRAGTPLAAVAAVLSGGPRGALALRRCAWTPSAAAACDGVGVGMGRLGAQRRSVHPPSVPVMAAKPPAEVATSWNVGDDGEDDDDDADGVPATQAAEGVGGKGGGGNSEDAPYDAAAVTAAFEEMVASGEFDDLDEEDQADIAAATTAAATSGRGSGGRPGRPGAPLSRPSTPNAAAERQLRRAGVLANLPAGLRIANTDAKCPGCGCYVQATDTGAPGYVPPNVLVEYKDAADAAVVGVTEGGDPLPPPPPPLCQRCFRLRHYGDIDVSLRVGARTADGAMAAGLAAAGAAAGEAGAPTVAVTAAASGADGDTAAAGADAESAATFAAEAAARNAANRRVLTPEVFRKNLARLASRPAVIIYLVDVIDFQGTFLSDLRSLVGPSAPILMALNKADLLPAGYSAERVARWARVEARSLGVDALTSVHLTSARTGAGVKELLADAILLGRQTDADVYVVGAANVGKSTLINQLLAGVDRMRGGKALAAAERLRIRSEQAAVARAAAAAMAATTGGGEGDVASGAPDTAVDAPGAGTVGGAAGEDSSHVTTPAEARAARKRESAARAAKLLTTSVIPGTTLGMVRVPLGGRLSLFDTPGVILPRSLTHRLTAAELRAVLPTRRLVPVTLRLGVGKALYLGGLARIEVVAGRPFFFSAFVSGDVKVHPGKADDGAAFTARHTGGLLTPPFQPDRAAALGSWSEQVVEVSGAGWKTASVDVVLSGLGWVALTGVGEMTLRVATPGGVGVFVRDALMPYETEGGVGVYTGGTVVNRRAERKSKQARARRRRRASSDW
ncbi:hypothetical protein MMPV_009263 [Pyropia vietnamensis]